MISDLMLGRLILMGFIVDEYYGDIREYQSSDKTLDDKIELAYETSKATIATVTVWAPLWKTTLIGTGGRVFGTWALAKAGAIATVAAPITAGYMIGAAVGTAISQQLFGDEGAQTALGFYSLGLLPGTEAPTLDTYGNLLRPSETDVPGPVDLVQDAVETVSVLVNFILKGIPRSPRRPRFANPVLRPL